MNIALLGYGKMGKEIEAIALQRGHTIVLKVDETNAATFTKEDLQKADVAIEFSTPHTVISNIKKCFEAQVPIVVGTTGWYDSFTEIEKECQQKNGALFHATNFSLGVNLFFKVNSYLAELMNKYDSYNVEMEEIHHIHKLDSPSGTAITIAEDIIGEFDKKNEWVDVKADDDVTIHQPQHLIIESYREGEVPGTHAVIYDSDVDRIELKHVAHGRQGFALGAVIAAEWLKGKNGFYSVKEMYDFKAS